MDGKPYEPCGCQPAKIGDETCPRDGLADAADTVDATGICTYVVAAAAGDAVETGAIPIAMAVDASADYTGDVETVGVMTAPKGIFFAGNLLGNFLRDCNALLNHYSKAPHMGSLQKQWTVQINETHFWFVIMQCTQLLARRTVILGCCAIYIHAC